MTHRLHLLVEQLDLATEHALASAEALGPRAYVPPVPGQWAAAQVIHHVLTAELKIVNALQKSLATSHDTWRLGTLKSKLRSTMLRLALRLPGLKFKVPPTLAPPPAPEAIEPLPQLREQWNGIRRRLGGEDNYRSQSKAAAICQKERKEIFVFS